MENHQYSNNRHYQRAGNVSRNSVVEQNANNFQRSNRNQNFQDAQQNQPLSNNQNQNRNNLISQQNQNISNNNNNNNNDQNQNSSNKTLYKKFKRCCCHHAPSVIILDIIIVLILIGEIILVQNKQLEFDNSSSQSNSSTSNSITSGFNYTFTYGNQSITTTTPSEQNSSLSGSNGNQTSDSDNSTASVKTSLWEICAGSIVVIPLNTFLIAVALRLLFCKIPIEAMKFSLLGILFFLYISSMIGVTLYSTQSNLDLFKQNFFLQYIILTISLVLGFLTEIIALLMMAYYFMKVMQVQIKKVSHLYLIEQQEAYLSKHLLEEDQNEQLDPTQNQEINQNGPSNNIQQNNSQHSRRENNGINRNSQQLQLQILSGRTVINQILGNQHNNPITGIVRALTNNTNYVDQYTNQNLIENSQVDISNANLLLSPNNNRESRQNTNNFLNRLGGRSSNARQTIQSSRNSQQSHRNGGRLQRSGGVNVPQLNGSNLNTPSNNRMRSLRSPLAIVSPQSNHFQRRFVMNGIAQALLEPQSFQSTQRSRDCRSPIAFQFGRQGARRIATPLNRPNDNSNNSSFTFIENRRDQSNNRIPNNSSNNFSRLRQNPRSPNFQNPRVNSNLMNPRTSPQSNQSLISLRGLGGRSNSSEQSQAATTCSICTQRLDTNIVKMQNCQHIYHKKCLQSWTRVIVENGVGECLQNNQSQLQCPMCNLK